MTASRFIGIICGLKSEAAVIRAAAPRQAVRIAVSGASAARAESQATRLCREGAAAILSVGISGGLSPALRPGDLLLGECVRTRAGEEFDASRNLLAAVELESPAVAMQRATVFGADEIVASVSEKRRLFDRFGAAAVDMESHGAARAARAAGAPFLAIRAIADPADRALPAAALNAVTPDGGTRTISVLMACALAPGQFPALMRLGADSQAALKALRGGLGRLLGRLLLSLDL
ncbi:MAG: purine phosphorylase [Amphiplicatus sp.]